MFQVNKSSSDFWNSLKLTWQQCAEVTLKCWAESIAELNGKVYVTTIGSKHAHFEPLMYDSNKDQWSTLPALPFACFSLVTVPDNKQLLAIGGDHEVIGICNQVYQYDKVNRKWTTPYPNMPTARCHCSSISHGSTVIVAGGVTCWDPWTLTRAVEVLHIEENSWFSKSHWSVVEQMPLLAYMAIPLIVNDNLYITAGLDRDDSSTTCNIVMASLPELLQSSSKNTSSGQVWYKLPDMPFSGCHRVEQATDEPILQSVPLIHIYNPSTNSWDCIGKIPFNYLLCRSVHIRNNQILFIGGLTGTCGIIDDDMITTCSMLTLSPH